jgi:catechol 2,3-dioxygenase-like lactoylglutathione lyase family enzyme
MAKPIPENYHALTSSLAVDNAAQAIEFYKRAFGAKERGRMPGPGDTIAHAELKPSGPPARGGRALRQGLTGAARSPLRAARQSASSSSCRRRSRRARRRSRFRGSRSTP